MRCLGDQLIMHSIYTVKCSLYILQSAVYFLVFCVFFWRSICLSYTMLVSKSAVSIPEVVDCFSSFSNRKLTCLSR